MRNSERNPKRWAVPAHVERLLASEPDESQFSIEGRRVWLKRASNGVWTAWVELLEHDPLHPRNTDASATETIRGLAHCGVQFRGPAPWGDDVIVAGWHFGHSCDLIPADSSTHDRPYRDWSYVMAEVARFIECLHFDNAGDIFLAAQGVETVDRHQDPA